MCVIIKKKPKNNIYTYIVHTAIVSDYPRRVVDRFLQEYNNIFLWTAFLLSTVEPNNLLIRLLALRMMPPKSSLLLLYAVSFSPPYLSDTVNRAVDLSESMLSNMKNKYGTFKLYYIHFIKENTAYANAVTFSRHLKQGFIHVVFYSLSEYWVICAA